MACDEIKILLKETIGLHADAVGDSSIERAIRQRMNSLEITDAKEYLSRLKPGTSELAELIEEVVVPETWFFRNVIPFETLAKFVPALLANTQNRFLRILSLPCSTGEEPYSIAMTLLECRSAENFDFVIDSVDVSKKAITKAKRAVYGNYSFREGDGIEAIKEKYFNKEKNGYHLKIEVKNFVKPEQGNVLIDPIAPTGSYYDVIFCRNLLIYFDRETQSRVLGKLDSMLKPTGILFLGHAETSQAVNDHFARIDIPKAFAFRKKAAAPIVTNREKAVLNIQALEAAYQQLRMTVPAKKSLSHNGDMASPAKKKAKRQTTGEKAVSREEASSHELITHQIELGRLTEAVSECEKVLKDNPDSSEAYYFLGLINHLEGNGATAESLLKKAMYLDPNHHGALGLSAMLAEKRGDTDIALALRRREQRVIKRKSSQKNPDN